jgi:hypothetical protein
VEGIKTRLEYEGSSWVEDLPHVLWTHRTINKTSHGNTPFSLTYISEAMIPAEIGVPSAQFMNVNALNNDEELSKNLGALEIRRELAAIKEAKHINKKEMAYKNFL